MTVAPRHAHCASAVAQLQINKCTFVTWLALGVPRSVCVPPGAAGLSKAVSPRFRTPVHALSLTEHSALTAAAKRPAMQGVHSSCAS